MKIEVIKILGVLLVFSGGVLNAAAQTSPLRGNLKAGAYRVGYKTFDETDGSRSFPQKNGDAFVESARKIRISVWYPAKPAGNAAPMRFREYLYAMEGATEPKMKQATDARLRTFTIGSELPETALSTLLQITHPAEEVARFGIREDLSFLDGARYSERTILRFPAMRHADFTSRALIETFAAKMSDAQTLHRRLAFETAANYVAAFFKANLAQDKSAIAFLEDAPQTVKFTTERKAAARADVGSRIHLPDLHGRRGQGARAVSSFACRISERADL